MASSRKKVLLRDLNGQVHAGHLPLQEFVHPDPATNSTFVDLLDLEGRVTPIPLTPLKWIAWVRDWNLNDPTDPERFIRRTFLARPRTEGLWVRIGFSAGDTLEGLASRDLLLLDGLLHDRGLFLMPPDVRSNTQRIFVPRTAMTSLEIVAVITSPSKKSATSKARISSGNLFPDS